MILKKIALSLCVFSLLNANAQTFTNFTTADGLVSDNVICADVDQSDNLWFGTQNGVSMYNGTTWTTYESGTFTGMADDNIQAIFIDSNDEPWIGTDFGTSVFNGSTWTTYAATEGLGNEQIKCIGQDASGDMWFGTSGGASRFDGSTWTNYGTSDGIPFGGVNSITLKSNGDLWLGTGLSGVRVYDGTNFNEITAANDGLVNDRIRTIAFEANDYVWVGTAEGITLLNPTDVFQTNYTTIFTLPAPDTLNPIEAIEIDGNGNIWVGVYVDYLVTEGGISVYNGSEWMQYEVVDGLVGPVVRTIAIDSNNDVWVGTSTGISKISNLDYLKVNEDEPISVFSIYPNPAANDFTVQAFDLHENKVLEIYNASMQLVKSDMMSSGLSLTISTLDMASGLYFVKMNDQVKKLIVR
jgi:ligand-binding sensor domain-containing protein